MATFDNTIRITSYDYLDEVMSSCDILCVHENHLYYQHKNLLTTINVNFSGHVNMCDENNP